MASKEDIEQIKVMEYLRQCHPNIPVIHIANQRQTSPEHGRLLKRMGVRAGVADLFFPCSGVAGKKGLWIELKSSTGKPSELQLDFLSEMILADYEAKVCYGADEAIEVIKCFYSL